MGKWIWLFLANRVLASLCPWTSKVGAVLSLLCLVATYVFIVLTFIYAGQWWYGLVSIGIYLLTPLILPKMDADAMSNTGRLFSGIGSIISEILVVLMYLALFKII